MEHLRNLQAEAFVRVQVQERGKCFALVFRIHIVAQSLQTDVHMKLYCVYVSYAVNLCTNAYRKLYNTVCTHMWSVEN